MTTRKNWLQAALNFTVEGTPAPQGSKRYIGHGRMIESSKQLPAWRKKVTQEARQAATRQDWHPEDWHTFMLDVIFTMPRPKNHFRTGRYGGQVRAGAPGNMGRKPDLDKLTRAVGDALTDAGVIPDDAAIDVIRARKDYQTGECDKPRVEIRLHPTS